jgi:hypothetical protein
MIARSKGTAALFRTSYRDQTGVSGFHRFTRKIVENSLFLRILSFGACVVPVSGDHETFAYTIRIEHVEDLMHECLRDASASAPRRYIHLDYGRPTIDAIGTLDIRG